MSITHLPPDEARAKNFARAKAIPLKHLRSDGSVTAPGKSGIEVLPPCPARAALYDKAPATSTRYMFPDGSVYDMEPNSGGDGGMPTRFVVSASFVKQTETLTILHNDGEEIVVDIDAAILEQLQALHIDSLVEDADYDPVTNELVFTRENGTTFRVPISALVSNLVTQTQLAQAIDTEANARQGQITQLNSQIVETNHVLSTIHTSKTTAILNTVIDGDTNVYFTDLNNQTAANFSVGQSFVRDAAGTLAVVVAIYDDTGVTARTITVSGGEASLGLAKTVYFNDQIQLTAGMPVSIDTGIVLKDGADYQIVISAMSGTTGASASAGNGLMPQAIINGAAYGLAGNQNANALLNTIYRFRWQMHNMASNPVNNVVGAFPLFGGTTISTVIYSSSANFDVDGAGIATTYGTQPTTLFRVQTPIDDVPMLRLATPAAPSGNMRFMVKVIEVQSAFPTN